ncbi:hypothetical protein [Staphylococcus pseudintermedius]|uniref:hypothetical protein n=1 Tax=Staphylococcus pseudintermedius TaxID=283734 RepID=UPI00194FD2F5|nr:hypothetical protein [Staphylococcus pseudintermedius]MDU9297374.1 hypothetical protein [Staphylococcus pseudintermedius]MDU9298926.1 hypothetical protein [Staphylococcus pseudintermedius]MDU9301635.1 hypothetical protein [Staphylococcus pseudintermedius]
MTTNDLVKELINIGYKVSFANKNVTRRKSKIQITPRHQKQPTAWVFINEMYSMRSLGIDEETYKLLVNYSMTPINER